MNFEAAKLERDLLEKEAAAAGDALQIFSRGGLGASDATRLTADYRTANARFQKAFARLRKFNSVFTKEFAKELRSERAAQYKARLDNRE
jgi:hypothetical protein